MDEQGHKEFPAQYWLRYRFARLTAWRNLFVAALIAGLCCAAVVMTAQCLLQPTQRGTTTGHSIPLIGTTTTASVPDQAEKADYQLTPPTPEILAHLPIDTAAVVYPIPQNIQGKAREEFCQQLKDELSEKRGPWSAFDNSGIRVFQEDAQGDLIEPCPSIIVERGEGWDHTVVFTADGKHRYHTYIFTYSCGHRASITPDAYQDLMYAKPEAVAKAYAGELCPDCESMREHLEANPLASEPRGKDGG